MAFIVHHEPCTVQLLVHISCIFWELSRLSSRLWPSPANISLISDHYFFVPLGEKLPLFSTNVHLHPLSLQTFRLSSVPHKNPLRHDYLGRGPINKRHVSELVIFQERLLYNTGGVQLSCSDSYTSLLSASVPLCKQLDICGHSI